MQMQRVTVTQRCRYADEDGVERVLNPGESILMEAQTALSFAAEHTAEGAAAAPERTYPAGTEYDADGPIVTTPEVLP